MDSLLQTNFIPLAEVKAKLSEKLRDLGDGRRILITSHGRPKAVLLSYGDFLGMLQKPSSAISFVPRRIKFKAWEKESPKRELISKSITRLFATNLLPRKGQKEYKQKIVDSFSRGSKS
jgi:prevent-host-death family protein